MDTLELKNRIVRAAIVWERAFHEKISSYTSRDLGAQETELIEATREYNKALVTADAGEPTP
jgi:hypothetical protein